MVGRPGPPPEARVGQPVGRPAPPGSGFPPPAACPAGPPPAPARRPDDRPQVVAADRGKEFAFVVGGAFVRWGYAFVPVTGGPEVTESWEFLPAGIAMFGERFGEDAPSQIDDRAEAAHRGIPLTLAAIKRVAESA